MTSTLDRSLLSGASRLQSYISSDAIVRLPKGAHYCWYMVAKKNESGTAGKTHLLFKTGDGPFLLNLKHLDDGDRVKITAYARNQKTQNFMCLGTCIFKVATGAKSDVHMGIDSEPTDFIRLSHPSNKRNVKLKNFEAIDLYENLAKDMKKVLAQDKGNLERLTRHAFLSWEWPFCIAGYHGVRELGLPVPGWKVALPWLEWHALRLLGLGTWGDCTTNELKLDVMGLALGAIAYLNGYDTEVHDDTSKPWCALGTGKDCDDFSADVCALVNAIHADKSVGADPDTLWGFVKSGFGTPFMIAGHADPYMNGGSFAHMWSEIEVLKTLTDKDGKALVESGTRLPVESTAAVTFFGSAKGEKLQFGVRQAKLESYLARSTAHTADKTFYFDPKSQTMTPRNLHGAVMPKWYNELSYSSPDPSEDKNYKLSELQKLPGPDAVVYGWLPSRKLPPAIRDSVVCNNIRTIRVKILPFSVGEVVWFLEPVDIEAVHKRGSYH